MPPIAVLAGLLLTVSFAMSHSTVQVEGTDWVDPVLLWIAICMPTGSGKSALCKFLKSLVETSQKQCNLTENDPSWWLDDQSFEKMGAMMADNHGKLIGLYDELSMFLSQINVFRSKGLSDLHEMALFLQLYGASSWIQRTGTSMHELLVICMTWLYFSASDHDQILKHFLCYKVSGDANFSIQRTGMTLGGFIQPSVARALIDQQSNVEKGLCQRFLWIVPKPTFVNFDQLQQVDTGFISSIGEYQISFLTLDYYLYTQCLSIVLCHTTDNVVNNYSTTDE